jgi:hypothetical protein
MDKKTLNVILSNISNLIYITLLNKIEDVILSRVDY